MGPFVSKLVTDAGIRVEGQRGGIDVYFITFMYCYDCFGRTRRKCRPAAMWSVRTPLSRSWGTCANRRTRRVCVSHEQILHTRCKCRSRTICRVRTTLSSSWGTCANRRAWRVCVPEVPFCSKACKDLHGGSRTGDHRTRTPRVRRSCCAFLLSRKRPCPRGSSSCTLCKQNRPLQNTDSFRACRRPETEGTFERMWTLGPTRRYAHR